MKKFTPILAVVLLPACSSQILPVANTVQATTVDILEFQRETRIQDKGTNVYTFAAGARLPLDRGNSFDRVYCGPAQYNVERLPKNVCLGVEGKSTIVVSPSSASQRIRRPQPAGAFRVIKAGR